MRGWSDRGKEKLSMDRFIRKCMIFSGMEARQGYEDTIPSSALLSKERIMQYYILINQKYGINTTEGLRTYIYEMLDRAS